MEPANDSAIAYNCPCKGCNYGDKLKDFIKAGTYFRKDDSRYINRYRCPKCGKYFSSATFDPAYRQKKRRVNSLLYTLLNSNTSMRRASMAARVNIKTVARKLIYLAERARVAQKDLHRQLGVKSIKNVQFDDILSIEHTKLKPLSGTLAVEKGSRAILGIEVSSMPAFGHLAKLSRKKYGRRKDDRKKGLDKLFRKIKPLIDDHAIFESDEHRLYPGAIKEHFPQAKHHRYKGGRGCIAGQGELKKLAYDPLFSLNHTCAMLRYNISRLVRKTWSCTKIAARLQDHFDLYIDFHNRYLLKNLI